MAIDKVYAVVCTATLSDAMQWYANLLGRKPDLTPMAEVHEWHYGTAAGIQLLDDAAQAGHSKVTLIVDDIERTRTDLAARGLTLGALSRGDFASVAQIRDLDGNIITFAEPGPAARRP